MILVTGEYFRGKSIMKKIKLNTIKAKLIIVSVLFLTVPLIIMGFISYQKSATSLDDLGKTNLKNSVEHTIELADALNEQVEDGNLTLEQAQEKVKVAILGEMQDGKRPINSNFDLGENGYLFVTNSDGITVAHPNVEGSNSWDNEDSNGNKYVQEYLEIGLSGGGYSYYDYPLPDNENQIGEKVVYSKAFPDWGWVVIASTYLMDFNEPANELSSIVLIVIGAVLLVGIFIIWLFANTIANPIRKVTSHLNNLAQGDLTKEKVQVKSKDETGLLANALNELQDKIRIIIQNISAATDSLSSQSEELSQSSNEVMQGSEQIASTMQELSSGAETQANNTGELSMAMQNFAQEVEDADQYGEQIYDSSGEVLTMTNEGSELMDSSKKQMNVIHNIVKEAVQKVRGLDAHSQEISKLVSVIQDVAEQTNLLALNAAIEAARAGEHGQGFAVVADEVRKLAEQVSGSVTDITEIVTNIQKESSIVMDSLQGGYEEVERGTKQIDTTGEKFEGINHAVKEMVSHIRSVTESLSSIAATNQQMNSSVQEIASVSEESAAGIEQTSASSEQTSSSMEEVAASSEELAKLAEELTQLVRQFKL